MSTEHTTQQDSEEQEAVVQVEPTVPPDAEVTPQASEVIEIEQAAQDKPPPEPKSKPEGDTVRDREPGKSVLPFTRVQKIMKADKVGGFQLFPSAAIRVSTHPLRVTCHPGPSYGRQRRDVFDLASDGRVYQKAFASVSETR